MTTNTIDNTSKSELSTVYLIETHRELRRSGKRANILAAICNELQQRGYTYHYGAWLDADELSNALQEEQWYELTPSERRWLAALECADMEEN